MDSLVSVDRTLGTLILARLSGARLSGAPLSWVTRTGAMLAEVGDRQTLRSSLGPGLGLAPVQLGLKPGLLGWAAIGLASMIVVGTAQPAAAYISLQSGDRGVAVANLQRLLQGIGQQIEPTGNYNFATERSVKAFQSEIQTLQPTGKVDISTLSALLDLNRDWRPGRPLPPQPFLVRGDRGPSVVALQSRLRQAGFFPASLQITGIFDEATRLALTDYQKRQEIPVTGVVDQQTQARLDRTTSEPGVAVPVQPAVTIRPNPVPQPVNLPAPTFTFVVPPPLYSNAAYGGSAYSAPTYGGNTGLSMAAARSRQAYIESVYRGWRQPQPGVAFGETPLPIGFPGQGGRARTGVNWTAVPTSSTCAALLAPGQTSSRVARLQGQLRTLGYMKSHTNTGYFGPLTQEAILAYQGANGLAATGAADADLLCRLAAVQASGRRGSPNVPGYQARPWLRSPQPATCCPSQPCNGSVGLNASAAFEVDRLLVSAAVLDQPFGQQAFGRSPGDRLTLDRAIEQPFGQPAA